MASLIEQLQGRSRLVTPGAAEDRIAREVGRTIETALNRLGILGRVFFRTKSAASIMSKLKKKAAEYEQSGRKMQDLFGVRVTVYFQDDSDIAQELVKTLFEFEGASVSAPSGEIFGPTRCNLVFRLPRELADQSTVLRTADLIDNTFEVQFRTVLSEGWHEVEHDLRYKRKADWAKHADLSRALNGVVATLESCDWTMVKIFDELAWRHYRAGSLGAMVQTKFRIRLSDVGTFDDAVRAILLSDKRLRKALFRSDRRSLLRKMMQLDGQLPLTAQNIVFLCNRFFIHNADLTACEPEPVAVLLDRFQAQPVVAASVEGNSLTKGA